MFLVPRVNKFLVVIANCAFQFKFQTLWNIFFYNESLRKFLCDLYLTAFSLSRFSFSAICSLFLLDDLSCHEQCVISLSSSPTSIDVEVCSTSIVGVSSSCFLLDGILLCPSSPSLAFVLKTTAD